MADEVTSYGLVPEANTHVELPVALESIQAGFPAPNGGYIDGNLDVNEFLVNSPSSTYIYRVSGESMIEAGIMPGDFVLVDSSVKPENGDVVVACFLMIKLKSVIPKIFKDFVCKNFWLYFIILCLYKPAAQTLIFHA